MSSINYVSSINLTCSRNATPGEKVPLTLTTRSGLGIVQGENQGGELTYILSKKIRYQAVFERNVFQNEFSGLKIHNNGITRDISGAKYDKRENRLTFVINIPLTVGCCRSVKTVNTHCRMTLFAKDGISDEIHFNGNAFILSCLRVEKGWQAIEFILGMKNSNEKDLSPLLSNTPAQPLISSETSPQISPNSVSPTSTDETAASIPFASSVEVIFSRKGSNDEVKLMISAKQSKRCVVYDESSKTTIFSKDIRYSLTKFEEFFKAVPSIFVHKEDELFYLPNISPKNDQLDFKIKIDLLQNKHRTMLSSDEHTQKAKHTAVRLYISGINAQGEEVLLRTDGNSHLISKLKGSTVLKTIKSILALKGKHLPFTEEWPEVIPAENMPKVIVELSQTSVSNINSITPEQLRIQRSLETAKKSLRTTAKQFKEKGQQRAAVAAFDFAKAFNSFSLSNVDEARAVMSLLTQVGSTLIESLGQTEVIDTTPTIQDVEEDELDTDEDTFSASGKAEESSSEGLESDNEESEPLIKIRRKNKDTSVHSNTINN